ncbi:MAG: Holliday junction resolvase-like protein, partial [Thermoplasmata archaeon]
RATEGAEKKAIEVGIGLVVEKIVPNWKAFSYDPPDCRPLFEPIDYVIFDGMTKKERVDSIVFMDIKTGSSRLSKSEKLIRDAVESGRVRYRYVTM